MLGMAGPWSKTGGADDRARGDRVVVREDVDEATANDGGESRDCNSRMEGEIGDDGIRTGEAANVDALTEGDGIGGGLGDKRMAIGGGVGDRLAG